MYFLPTQLCAIKAVNNNGLVVVVLGGVFLWLIIICRVCKVLGIICKHENENGEKDRKKTKKKEKHRRLTGENDNKSTQLTCLLKLHREEREAAMFSRRLVAILVYLYAFMTIIELLPYLQSTIFCLLLFVYICHAAFNV